MKTNETHIGISINTNAIHVFFAKTNHIEHTQTVIARKSETIESGLERGYITNPREVASVIKKMLDSIERLHSTNIEEVIVSFNPLTLTSRKKKVKRNIEKESTPFVINERDISDMQANMFRTYANTYPNNEVLVTKPLTYAVDHTSNLDQITDLTAKKEFSGETFFISCFRQHKQSLEKVFHILGLDILEMYPSAFVTASVLFNKEQKRSGALFIDIDSETTAWTYFNKGVPYSTGCVGTGIYDIACEAANSLGMGLSHVINSVHNNRLNDDIIRARKSIFNRIVRKIVSEIKATCPVCPFVGGVIILVPEGSKYECERICDVQINSNITYIEKKNDNTQHTNNGSWMPVQSLITYHTQENKERRVEERNILKSITSSFLRKIRSHLL